MDDCSVVGLGKLGLPLALILADKGAGVTGIDVNGDLVQKLQNQEYMTTEPKVNELLQRCGNSFKATTSFESVGKSSIIFILVPTPSTPNDPAFSDEYIRDVLLCMVPHLRGREDYYLIVVVSTVMPGAMAHIKGHLEKMTGAVCGKDFGLCYNPEFVALGDVVMGMEHPEVVLIGESDPRAGAVLSDIYIRLFFSFQQDSPPGVRISRMSLANAEVSKLALNVFVTMKISMANMLAGICEQIPGGDIDAVTRFMGSDPRVGPKSLQGGLGFGGTCFPRDVRAFQGFSRDSGVFDRIPEALSVFNDLLPLTVMERVNSIIPHGSKVAILGLSYKPGTPIIEESQAVNIALKLREHGYNITAYDPLSSWMKLPLGFEATGSIKDCLRGADLCIIAVPHQQFLNLPFDCMAKARVLDCWRLLDRKALVKAGVEYHAVGLNDGG